MWWAQTEPRDFVPPGVGCRTDLNALNDERHRRGRHRAQPGVALRAPSQRANNHGLLPRSKLHVIVNHIGHPAHKRPAGQRAGALRPVRMVGDLSAARRNVSTQHSLLRYLKYAVKRLAAPATAVRPPECSDCGAPPYCVGCQSRLGMHV